MELIKSFVKYSKLYRTCDDFDQKNVIYQQWSIEAGDFKYNDSCSCGGDDNKNNNNCRCHPYQHQRNACEFCFHFVDSDYNNNNNNNDNDNDLNEKRFVCDNCLFPLSCSLTCNDKELFTYLLLSACFYEENAKNINLWQQTCERVSIFFDDDYLVWVQRIKFVWNTNKHINEKKYVNVRATCLQCDAFSLWPNLIVKTFDYRLFCQYCLFPLFKIVNCPM
nr:hypothetical protein Caab_088 [Calliteara abietis nucleopolyhedrovirus]